MPFDETPHHGGGGGGGDHDPQRMYDVANSTLNALNAACDIHGLCYFHTHMTMHTVMIERLVEFIRRYGDTPQDKAAAVCMGWMQIEMLETLKGKLEEEIAKHG